MSKKEFILDIDEMFDDFITSNQKEWSHDRSKTVGASEVFGCLRKAWFGKLGEKHGFEQNSDFKQSWGAMQRGNIIENHHFAPAFQDFLPEPLKALFVEQSKQKTFIEGRSSATPDGLLVNVPEGTFIIRANGNEVRCHVGKEKCIGLEFKSIDPRATLGEEKVVHHGQSQMGMELIRRTTEWQPNNWLILYVDASFIDKFTPFLITYDKSIGQSGVTRAKKVFDATDPMALPAEGRVCGDCDYCMFTEACGEAEYSRYKKLDLQDKDKPPVLPSVQLEDLVQRYVDARQKEKDATEDFKLLKEEMKDSLAETGLRQFFGSNWKVTWSFQQGRTTVNTKAAEEAGVDLEPYKKKGKGFDKLIVTVKD